MHKYICEQSCVIGSRASHIVGTDYSNQFIRADVLVAMQAALIVQCNMTQQLRMTIVLQHA